MTVVAVTKDRERSSMTIVAEYRVSASLVWQLWADPRRLEWWWGPPTHPATVTDHSLTAGGVVRYFMTGPDGERYHGGWRVVGAEERTGSNSRTSSPTEKEPRSPNSHRRGPWCRSPTQAPE